MRPRGPKNSLSSSSGEDSTHGETLALHKEVADSKIL